VSEYRQHRSDTTPQRCRFGSPSGISFSLGTACNENSAIAADLNKLISTWRLAKLHHGHLLTDSSIPPAVMHHLDATTQRIIHGSRVFRRTHMGHAHGPHPVHHHHNSPDEDGSTEAGERVSRIGLIADVFLTAGKGFAGYVSGSTAIIADAAHSMSDVVRILTCLCLFGYVLFPRTARNLMFFEILSIKHLQEFSILS
jgi:hypothetical protein